MGPMKSSMYSHPAGPCNHCGVETTPCWRKGPVEKPHLCNACGSRWLAKHDLKGYHPGKRTPCRPEFTREVYSKGGSQQSYSDSGSGFGKVPTKRRKVRSYDGSESIRTSAFRPWIVQKADASTQTDGPDMVPVVIMRPSFPPFAGYGLERMPSNMSMAPSIVECLSRTTSFNKEGPSTPYTAAAVPAPFERVVPGSLAECNGLSACNNPRPSLFKTKEKLSNSCPSESCPTTIYVDSRLLQSNVEFSRLGEVELSSAPYTLDNWPAPILLVRGSIVSGLIVRKRCLLTSWEASPVADANCQGVEQLLNEAWEGQCKTARVAAFCMAKLAAALA